MASDRTGRSCRAAVQGRAASARPRGPAGQTRPQRGPEGQTRPPRRSPEGRRAGAKRRAELLDPGATVTLSDEREAAGIDDVFASLDRELVGLVR
jgi:hypothetical protein